MQDYSVSMNTSTYFNYAHESRLTSLKQVGKLLKYKFLRFGELIVVTRVIELKPSKESSTSFRQLFILTSPIVSFELVFVSLITSIYLCSMQSQLFLGCSTFNSASKGISS